MRWSSSRRRCCRTSTPTTARWPSARARALVRAAPDQALAQDRRAAGERHAEALVHPRAPGGRVETVAPGFLRAGERGRWRTGRASSGRCASCSTSRGRRRASSSTWPRLASAPVPGGGRGGGRAVLIVAHNRTEGLRNAEEQALLRAVAAPRYEVVQLARSWNGTPFTLSSCAATARRATSGRSTARRPRPEPRAWRAGRPVVLQRGGGERAVAGAVRPRRRRAAPTWRTCRRSAPRARCSRRVSVGEAGAARGSCGRELVAQVGRDIRAKSITWPSSWMTAASRSALRSPSR